MANTKETANADPKRINTHQQAEDGISKTVFDAQWINRRHGDVDVEHVEADSAAVSVVPAEGARVLGSKAVIEVDLKEGLRVEWQLKTKWNELKIDGKS